jgi:hypothetical protein
MAVALGAVIVVLVVVGFLPGVAGAPEQAVAGPETPVPVGAMGGLLLGAAGLVGLLVRNR